MMPATLSIIRLTFPDEKECALAIGLWGAVAAGGSAIGPLIGGVLLEYFWWGSAFLINVPIVAVALAAALAVIPNEKGTSRAPWDFFGSLQILVGLVGVAYAIKEVAMAKPSYPAAAMAAVIGAAALAWFARRQRGRASPLIDFGLFADRGFRGAVMAALVSAFAVVGVALVLSQRLQLVLGYTPLGAALFMLPASVMAFVGGPLAGALVPRFGGDRVIMGALLLGGAGVAGLLATANAGLLPQLFFLAAYGLGAGAALAAASHAIMSHASAEHAGMAASIEEVGIELGGAIGVTVLGSLLAGVYSKILVLPNEAALPAAVRDGIDEALVVARTLPADAARQVTGAVHQAFDAAYFTALAVAAVLMVVVAVMARRVRTLAPN
jgi:DHA2 family multidrug resistance protein-like MFS transporter